MPRLIALTFPAGHPYGHSTIGSMEDLDAATLDDVQSFFATHYLPNNAVLTMAGDVDAETAFAKAERYFGPLAAGPEPAEPGRDAAAARCSNCRGRRPRPTYRPTRST